MRGGEENTVLRYEPEKRDLATIGPGGSLTEDNSKRPGEISQTTKTPVQFAGLNDHRLALCCKLVAVHEETL